MKVTTANCPDYDEYKKACLFATRNWAHGCGKESGRCSNCPERATPAQSGHQAYSKSVQYRTDGFVGILIGPVEFKMHPAEAIELSQMIRDLCET